MAIGEGAETCLEVEKIIMSHDSCWDLKNNVIDLDGGTPKELNIGDHEALIFHQPRLIIERKEFKHQLLLLLLQQRK